MHQAVVTRVGPSELGKAAAAPIKIAAVAADATDAVPLTPDVLSEAVNAAVAAVPNRTQDHRRGAGIINDEWDFCCPGEARTGKPLPP